MIPTVEQHAIFAFVKAGKGDLIVDAGAGTGKTSTLVYSLGVIPQRSILLAAFNKKIETALAEKVLAAKVPKGTVVHVKTFHAQGFAILRSKFKHLKVDKNATEQLINRCAGSMTFQGRRVAVKLLRAVKEDTYTRAVSVEDVTRIGYANDLFRNANGVLDERAVNGIATVVCGAYVAGQDFLAVETIDFCDMVWGPLVLELAPPSRYQAVIVDELQDISLPQLAMLKSLIAPGGRFIGIGDRSQAIYSWRGAVPDIVWAEFETRKATTLPLTISFRCSKAVVKDANRNVKSLRARPDAPEGAVTQLANREALVDALKGTEVQTFVLSRTNKDLLTMALYLWRCEVPFQLNAGEEMLAPLFDVLKNLVTVGTQAMYLASLTTWYEAESRRAEKANAAAWADRLDEQFAMLTVASQYAKPNKIAELLTDMIRLEGAHVMLSSVHKVKGLEAEHVFLLKQTFAAYRPVKLFPSGDPMPKQAIPQEEINIEHVAITRAKLNLFWVNTGSVADAPVIVSRARAAPITPAETAAAFARTDEEIAVVDDDTATRFSLLELD